MLRAWQISYQISRYVYHESVHSLQFLSVICFHVILGLPGPCFPSTCMSKAVLTAPMELSTCPFQRSLFSFRMRSRYSMQTRTSSSLDVVVTMSWGLTLQICLIIAPSIRCRHWRFGFVNGQVLLAWSIALYTQHLYTWPSVLKERWWEERTGSNSLNFFEAVFKRVVVESSQPSAAESMSPGVARGSYHLQLNRFDLRLLCGMPSKPCAVPWRCVQL